MAQKVGFIGGKFLPVHLGHVYSITKAATYVDELYVIVSWSKERDTKLCQERGNIKYISPEQRCSWLGELFAHNPIVKIIDIEDKYDIDNYNWEEGAEQFRKAIGKPITHVFSGEKGNDNIFRELYPEVKHIVISEKKEFPISATKIRQEINIFKYWKYFPRPVRAYYTKKILITGTESCGKSVLTSNLAGLFNTTFVHEIGRDYCEKYNNHITPQMFDNIAMEHYLLHEKQLNYADKLLFIDSDAVVTQYYLKMYHDCHSPFIDQIINKQHFEQPYDAIFYLRPDVEWVEDGLRFAGEKEERKKNDKLLESMYARYGIIGTIPFTFLSGSYQERLQEAYNYIKMMLR